MESKKRTITELLAEAKALKQKEIEIKQAMKAQKQTIAIEYADCLNPEEKQKQIAEAEKILNEAKQKAISAKMQFKQTMQKIRGDVSFAKEILEFVNHKQSNSLPKQKNSFVLIDNTLKFNREGIKEIAIDTLKENWSKTLKEELRKQGINGNDRVADNIVWKAQKQLEAHLLKIDDVNNVYAGVARKV